MKFTPFTDFTKHPQYYASQNLDIFNSWRISYYAHDSSEEFLCAQNMFVHDNDYLLLQKKINIQSRIDKIVKFNPDIFIITSSCNRLGNLKKLYESIISQKFNGKVSWIVIDNGSNKKTLDQLELWANEEKWMTFLSYKKAFGYATPARNKGLLFVYWILKYCTGKKYYWVIDSDDSIHNEYVLKELYNIAIRTNSVMTHGFTITNHFNKDGYIQFTNTIPRNITSTFPLVPTLRDEFDLGPQNLAAIIDCQALTYFCYPDEFTMEDDTLNQKIMLWSKKRIKRITAYDFPCLIKSFHENSMSSKNNKIGNSDVSVALGPTIVKGIRAQVVLGIISLRDYFTRERL